jgi:hypothetical protein
VKDKSIELLILKRIAMKKLLYLFFITIVFGCSSSTSTHTTINGHIENNAEYRGGANPPDFILEELAIYKPSANQTFYVRDAANYQPFTPISGSFSTDVNGDFSINLPEGNYAVICQDKYDFEQNPQATIECNYLAEPDFTLSITNGQQNYNLQYTNKRNNCTEALPN